VIQLIPRVQPFISFGSTDTYCSINGGTSDGGASSTYGANIARIPLPWAVTVRNLTLYSRDPARIESDVVAILKNNVATALTCTLPFSSTGPVTTSGVDVTYAALDDFSYKATTVTPNSHLIAWCLEAESQGNIFGINPVSGGASVGFGGVGGALGNGNFESYNNALPTTRSLSYSICYVPGNLTHLAMKSFGASYAGGSWIAHIILNGIVQDGSGGTVDTRCEVVDGNATALATFVLPLVVGDHVDVAYYRTGTDAAFELANIAIGIGFVPSLPGRFMLTGGSNNVVGTGTAYVWIRNFQEEATESMALAPIGPAGLRVRGFYVERGAPGPGESYVNTLRRNEGPTSLTVTIADADTSGLIEDLNVVYVDGDTIDIQSIASEGSSDTSRLHWGLDVSIVDVGITDVGVIGPHIWIDFNRTQPGSP